MTMKEALQKINTIASSSFRDSSLDSLWCWKDECGRIAREALAAEEESERKSQHDEHAEDLERRREQHALAVRDYEQRLFVNERLAAMSEKQIAEMDDLRRFREEEREHRAFHREHWARETAALEAIAATSRPRTTPTK